MKKSLYLFSIALVLSPFLFSQNNSYENEKTWLETLIRSRESLMKVERERSGVNKVEMGRWYSVGPFVSASHKPFEDRNEPEINPDLNATYGNLKWEEKTEYRDGIVNELPMVEYADRYLQRTLSVSNDTIIKAYFGSDDGIAIWINGNEVLANNANRSCAPNQEIIELHLTGGDNTMLMKISNNMGPTAFFFALTDVRTREKIWALLEKDFNSQKDIKEINWVNRDHIFDEDWNSGDYSSLIKRYADAIRASAPSAAEALFKQSSGKVTLEQLSEIHEKYLKIRDSEYVILTPKPSDKPKINGAKVFGVRPGSPVLFTIAATGLRPLEFSADQLPEGLSLDKSTGRIIGSITQCGEYIVTLAAKNKLGKAERQLKIMVGDQIALTPPLGWNSWNCFADAIDAEKVEAAADAMVNKGLINHGWSYINIDDFWEIKPGSPDPELQGAERDENGMINTNQKFPDMKALCDYVHGKGLKIGIYSSPGPLTCGGCVGSFQHEEKDAQRFGEWGIDYLKYDWCSYQKEGDDLDAYQKPYKVMRKALNQVNRDIVYSLCQYGMQNVWKWGESVGGNCWRTTGDITDTWQSMSEIGFSQNGHEKFAGPGHWNDPDMLVVGRVGWGPELHPTRLTPDEQYTHISLWSLLSSPLLIGCDMTMLDDFTLNLLTNDEVLDVNQDPLGKPASRISKSGDLEVWARDLEDGSKAVGLFNRGDKKTVVVADFASLGIEGKKSVRDLWRQKDLGSFEKEFRSFVNPHGVVLVKIK